MFKEISKLWLNSVDLFDPVQHFFNGEFWPVTSARFEKLLAGRVLDLACGTGELADHIAPKKYLGIDINGKYIHYAQTHRKLGNFVVGDISHLNLNGLFDTIDVISAAHHLSDQQLKNLSQAVVKLRPKKFLLIDGLPKKPFVSILEYLDAKLGGGDYFRDENELAKIFSQYFTIDEVGSYDAPNSFYYYPYLVATPTKP